MTDKVIRCAIYIRVSSAEQAMHGKSLESQTAFLSDFAEKKGWKIIGVFADEGKTARKELKRRKAIKSLLSLVEMDQVDMILFWKSDRWFRNVSDFYKVQSILDAHNCKWTSAAEPSMNLDTREGRLNVNIMLSINQNETDTTSERIKFVNENSVANGKAIVGNPSMPFGYKVEKIDGVKRVVKDESVSHIVDDMFHHFLNYHSKTGLLSYVNRTYGLNFSMQRILNITKSTLYYGCYRGNENYCPAYITKEEYEYIQYINKNNVKVYHSQNRDSSVKYIFTGLLKCPLCNHKLSGCYKYLKSGYSYSYRCPQHYTRKVCNYSYVVNQNTLESYLLDNIEKVYNEMLSNQDSFKSTPKSKKKETSIDKIEKELERLNNMYQKGRISEEKYDQEYERLKASISLAKIEKTNTFTIPKVNYSEIFVDGWKDNYRQMDPENKRAFWRRILHEAYPGIDSGSIDKITLNL